MEGEFFTVLFKCHGCGKDGTRTWQESLTQNRTMGEGRTLSSVSGGFHIEVGRTAGNEPLIVCDDCDEIQPD